MLIVVGLMIVFAGVNSLLKQQMQASLDIKDVSLGKQQALYLGEMGINQAMYEANVSHAFPALPKTYDFKSHIAMLSGDATGVASCTVTNDGGNPPYLVTATLTAKGTTYQKTLRFNATHRAATADTPEQWLLTNYQQMADATPTPAPTATP